MDSDPDYLFWDSIGQQKFCELVLCPPPPFDQNLDQLVNKNRPQLLLKVQNVQECIPVGRVPPAC